MFDKAKKWIDKQAEKHPVLFECISTSCKIVVGIGIGMFVEDLIQEQAHKKLFKDCNEPVERDIRRVELLEDELECYGSETVWVLHQNKDNPSKWTNHLYASAEIRDLALDPFDELNEDEGRPGITVLNIPYLSKEEDK